MAQANNARHAGDIYQGRVFWLNAANLLKTHDPIVEVAWETGPKGLDDVRVNYGPPKRSSNGPIERDFIQCKWHVGAGEFGYQQLTDPTFVNASKYSWLQRAYNAYCTENSPNVRFTLQTNWRVDAMDPLFELKRSESNELDLKKLFTGKTAKSKMGAVRECWCAHLDIDDDRLCEFAGTLKIADNVCSMDEIRERLDDRLLSVGLLTPPANHSAYVYDDLIIKLHGEGDVILNAVELSGVCDREGLWADVEPSQVPFTVGIRSFMHKYDDMEHRCDALLDLVPYFDGRFLQPAYQWERDIFPQLQAFVLQHAREHTNLRLRIDGHASIAFAIGRLLDVKSGHLLEIEQRTNGAGIQYWQPSATTSGSKLQVSSRGESQHDVVIALSITHDVANDVTQYCDGAMSDGYQFINARLAGDPSGIGIVDGGHAWRVAEALAAELRKIGQAANKVHFFSAAPNALVFFFAQQLGLGNVTTYEFDFERKRGGGYQKAWRIDEL